MDKAKSNVKSAPALSAQEEKKKRLSKALRANLQRRKRLTSDQKTEASCPSS